MWSLYTVSVGVRCSMNFPQICDALSEVLSRNQIHLAHPIAVLPRAQLIGQFCRSVFTPMCLG